MEDHDLLIRIDERVETIQRSLNDLCPQISDHEVRITSVEKKGKDNRSWLIALTTSLVTAIAGLVTIVLRHMGLAQ